MVFAFTAELDEPRAWRPVVHERSHSRPMQARFGPGVGRLELVPKRSEWLVDGDA
jgi:hypothetical protein